jgi:hypothetical protein
MPINGKPTGAPVSMEQVMIQRPKAIIPAEIRKYSSGVGRLVELQVSGEDLALRLALRSVDAGRGSGRG